MQSMNTLSTEILQSPFLTYTIAFPLTKFYNAALLNEFVIYVLRHSWIR